MTAIRPCPSCGRPTADDLLDAAHQHAFWHREDGACPACVQQSLLTELLHRGEAHFAQAVQRAWPLDAEVAFGALPAPLRLRADPRFIGRGVTMALIDSAFSPHPDLVRPINRISAWVDASGGSLTVHRFQPNDCPRWPGSDGAEDRQWHGTMTSVVAAGNGYLSQGLYAGVAAASRIVLIQVADPAGRISDQSILRALTWLESHAASFGIDVVSLSVAGDAASEPTLGPLERALERLVEAGITVVAAAGNDGERRLVPPATTPSALTIGGLDDGGAADRASATLWHSSYGSSATGLPKPELVAPSLWVVAPVLPGSAVAREGHRLFQERRPRREDVERRIADLKLVTPQYQHVDGTSFAAPLVASTVAAMLEANHRLTPGLVRELLIKAAWPVPGASPERQGAGALDAGRAVALALAERHDAGPLRSTMPLATVAGPVFQVHDHHAKQIEVFGSWDDWDAGVPGREVEPGLWTTKPVPLGPGEYRYKIRLDGTTWLADPANPWRGADGLGGINSRFNWLSSR